MPKIFADLAINPLLLTMIANVHRYSSSLPERRVESSTTRSAPCFSASASRPVVSFEKLTPSQKQLVLPGASV